MARRFDPVHLGSPRFHTQEHGPFLITQAWFPPGLVLPPHEHERPVVAVTLDGTWNSVMLRRPFESARATLLVEPAGERHSNHFGADGGRVLILQPDVRVGDELDSCRHGLDRPIAFGCGAALDIVLRMRAEMAAPDAMTPLALESLCLDLLVTTGRQSLRDRRDSPRWLTRVVEHIHAHAREPLTLECLAAIAGVHAAHLTRAFRRCHGTSVAAYVRSLRLAWAAEQLVDSRCRIADIAVDAGFADQSHFTRAFRAHTGRTPRQYRASIMV